MTSKSPNTTIAKPLKQEFYTQLNKHKPAQITYNEVATVSLKILLHNRRLDLRVGNVTSEATNFL